MHISELIGSDLFILKYLFWWKGRGEHALNVVHSFPTFSYIYSSDRATSLFGFTEVLFRLPGRKSFDQIILIHTDNILPSWGLNLFIFIFNIFLKYKFIILFKYVLLFWKTMRLNLNEKKNYFILICSYDVYVICGKSFISFKIKYIVTEFSNLRKKLSWIDVRYYPSGIK